MRGEKGLQALEWIARALVALALLAALAFGLRRTEAGLGEALSAAVSAWFRCLIGQGDCPLMAVRIEKAGPCWTQPVECLARWGDCLLQGACEGADPKDLLGLLPWLAVAGIPAGGVVFALLPPWVRRVERNLLLQNPFSQRQRRICFNMERALNPIELVDTIKIISLPAILFMKFVFFIVIIPWLCATKAGCILAPVAIVNGIVCLVGSFLMFMEASKYLQHRWDEITRCEE
jgi:hypothetical protein